MSNSLTITVTLPENFIEALNNEITDELSIAQRKWKIKLSDEEKEVVRKASFEQLRSKVSSLSKNVWDLGSKLVINVAGETGSLNIGPNQPVKSNLSFILNKNGWAATTEDADSVVHAQDFYSDLIKTLFTWTRTAVFYGVGSYSTK